MRITDIPRAVLRLQYRIARAPMQLIEDRVMARMASESQARLFYERSMGTIDAAVGNALGDSELKRRGTELAVRSNALSRAASLDAEAAAQSERAARELWQASEKRKQVAGAREFR
jgi:hypothetical protein